MARQLGQTTREKAAREVDRRQLEAWFGPLSETALDRFEALSRAQLMDVALAMRDAQSLADLGLEEAPA
jgi:hypothetical protein